MCARHFDDLLKRVAPFIKHAGSHRIPISAEEDCAGSHRIPQFYRRGLCGKSQNSHLCRREIGVDGIN
uniref:Uncharacterized protein n=1 Tax=Anguilla anguilla TaxID=7936 RepID=A0A0E9R5R4_ANGAN